MAQEMQLPFFGMASAAGAAATQSDWGDIENLDVELLAEYLLDDNGLSGNGVSFDFK